MKISPMIIGRKFIYTGYGIEDLHFNMLYVAVVSLTSQSFTNADGFKYHFQFQTEVNPLDDT